MSHTRFAFDIQMNSVNTMELNGIYCIHHYFICAHIKRFIFHHTIKFLAMSRARESERKRIILVPIACSICISAPVQPTNMHECAMPPVQVVKNALPPIKCRKTKTETPFPVHIYHEHEHGQRERMQSVNCNIRVCISCVRVSFIASHKTEYSCLRRCHIFIFICFYWLILCAFVDAISSHYLFIFPISPLTFFNY